MDTKPNPDALKETPLPSKTPATINPNRLSIPFIARVSGATTSTFLGGMFLGLTYGMKTAGLRFRAENAHRQPSTSTGWYLYHKSKNHHTILGGVKEGLKMGSKLAFLAGGLFVVEEAVDRLRGAKDCASTLIAGLTIAGGFSAWSRVPLVTAARIVKVGLLSSLAFGLLQDALGLARGRRVGYVDLFLGRSRRGQNTENLII